MRNFKTYKIRYFIQLTKGCGQDNCSNENCATGSSKTFDQMWFSSTLDKPLPPNEAVPIAFKLAASPVALLCSDKNQSERVENQSIDSHVVPIGTNAIAPNQTSLPLASSSESVTANGNTHQGMLIGQVKESNSSLRRDIVKCKCYI